MFLPHLNSRTGADGFSLLTEADDGFVISRRLKVETTTSSPRAASLTKSASIERVCGSVPVNSLVGPSFPLAGVCFQLEAAVIVYSVGLNENFTLMPSPGSLY